jgi:PAS domain S-box-containing protein
MDHDWIVQELQVYQVELDMQNEELRRAQVELEQSRARYFNLFDLAPVGYFTLSEKNPIVEANLAGAALLGAERSHLAGRRFAPFIARDFQDAFYLHHRAVLDTQSRQTCELKLGREDGTSLWAELTTTTVQDSEGDLNKFRVAVSDISERKQAECERENLAKFPSENPYPILRITMTAPLKCE